MNSPAKIHKMYRLAGTVLVLAVVWALHSASLHAQVHKIGVSGSAYEGNGVFGSNARGGLFNYSSGWPDGPSDLGVICLAGQQCDIDLPVEFYEDYHDPSYTEGCFASTCSAYLVGSITISTFSFKTPNQPDSMRIYVSGSVNVDGYIAGYYSNGVVGWELWHASFAGRGTERVELQNVGWNDYGQTQYLAVGAYAQYFATGSGMEEVSETPAPGTSASGVAVGNNSLFISQPGALGTISQLDKATGAVHNTFLTPSANGFDGRSTPSDIAFDGNHLFMTDMGSPGAGAVYDIDPLGTVVHNSFTLPIWTTERCIVNAQYHK